MASACKAAEWVLGERGTYALPAIAIILCKIAAGEATSISSDGDEWEGEGEEEDDSVKLRKSGRERRAAEITSSSESFKQSIT